MREDDAQFALLLQASSSAQTFRVSVFVPDNNPDLPADEETVTPPKDENFAHIQEARQKQNCYVKPNFSDSKYHYFLIIKHHGVDYICLK